MTVTERKRKRLIVARAGVGDVLPNEFARTICGGHLYFIKSIDNGYATAWDTARPGHCDIISVALLVRVPNG